VSVTAPSPGPDVSGTGLAPGPRSRGPRRRRLAIAIIALVGIAAAVVVVAAWSPGDSDGADADGASVPTSTATVQQGRLASQVYGNGTLGYAAQPDGSPWSVVNQAAGAFTSLPSQGAVKHCGDVFYRVRNEPVTLLCGRTPIYRALSEGMTGPDVRELNRNLVQLDYTDRDKLDPDSDDFTWRTAEALRDLQADLDVDETGILEPSDVVVLPGSVRVTKAMATLGTAARPGTPVAQATSTQRRVEVDLNSSEASTVEIGDRAQVTLPDNTTTSGRVSDIGTVAQGGKDDAGGKIPVYVTLTKRGDVKGLDEAPVQIQITTGRIKDALSVPVTALIALAGGGYAVETVGAGGARSRVPVKLGVFDHANGLVQVTGSQLSRGEKVVIPGT
jgi:hypothetical protein